MFPNKKIALAIAGGAIILGSGTTAVSIASADTPTPDPSPTQSWQRGGGFGRMGGNATDPNAGLRNGSGYGALADTEYLAGKLGVSQEAVAAALRMYHDANPTLPRGRDLAAAAQAERHATLAAFLAKELNVSEATVLDALNSQAAVRRADRTADLTSNLEQAVKDGRLTQAQADAILKAHEAGVRMGRMGGFGGGPRR